MRIEKEKKKKREGKEVGRKDAGLTSGQGQGKPRVNPELALISGYG